jgi:hypothetical protein
MTTTEFREYILVTYDSISNFAAPGYEDADINHVSECCTGGLRKVSVQRYVKHRKRWALR